jgi:hypothetical protein
MYYQWTSLINFQQWHEEAKTALGIPYPGYNAATGELDEDAQWTTAYTEPIIVSENDVRAFVEDYVVELAPGGLGILSEPPIEDLEL